MYQFLFIFKYTMDLFFIESNTKASHHHTCDNSTYLMDLLYY